MSVSECHGVFASGGDKGGWIELYEVNQKYIQLKTNYGDPLLTPEQARYLASRLNRMARRLDSNPKKEK